MDLLKLPDDLLAQIVDLQPVALRACSRKLKNLADGSAKRALLRASREVAPLLDNWLQGAEEYGGLMKDWSLTEIDRAFGLRDDDDVSNAQAEALECEARFSQVVCDSQMLLKQMFDKFAWHTELRSFACIYALYLQSLIEPDESQKTWSHLPPLTSDLFDRAVRLSLPLVQQAPWYNNGQGQTLDLQKTNRLLLCELVSRVLDNDYVAQNYTWPQPPEMERVWEFVYPKLYC